MKKVAIVLSVLAFSSTAFAADKLTESGFNVGINAGAVFGKSSLNLTDWEGDSTGEGTTGEKFKKRDTAGLLGLQVGYKHFLENGIMLGIEGDWQKSNYSANLNDTPYSEAALGQKVNDIFTLRAKAGKMVTDNTLAYVTAGYAYTIGDVKLHDGPYHTDGDTDKNVGSNGWVVGLGLEHSITENVSIKGEYLYLRTHGNAHTSTNNDNYNYNNEHEDYYAKTTFSANTLRVGVNYNF